MEQDTATLAPRYFESWKARDFGAFRSLLAADVTFDGPMGQARNADECVEGMRGMSRIVNDIVVQKVFVDDADVVTWFDLYTDGTGPVATANWSHVENGKIARIQVTFDPRSIPGDAGA